MKDSRGDIIVVDSYVRLDSRAPRRAYAWVRELLPAEGAQPDRVRVQNTQGRLGVELAASVTTLKPTLKAKAERERVRSLLGAVSARAHAGRRGL